MHISIFDIKNIKLGNVIKNKHKGYDLKIRIESENEISSITLFSDKKENLKIDEVKK